MILTTVGIECLSGYYAGQEANRDHFTNFIAHFMPEYAPFASDIYACVRNGLAHDYVIKRNSESGRTFVFQRDHGESHLTPSPDDPSVIYLNREDYARDFLRAQELYFKEVDTNQVVSDLAIKRLTSQRGFLTVRPIEEFGSRKSTASASSPPGASAIGLSTGTHGDPRSH